MQLRQAGHSLLHSGRFLAEPDQPRANDLLFPHALRHFVLRRFGARGKMFQGGEDAHELGRRIDDQLRGALEQRACRARSQRQAQGVVIEPETARLELDLQFAAFQHPPVLIAEHRQQHLVFEFAFERHPVDVEEARIG